MHAWIHVCALASFTENEMKGDTYSENVDLDLLLESTGVAHTMGTAPSAARQNPSLTLNRNNGERTKYHLYYHAITSERWQKA